MMMQPGDINLDIEGGRSTLVVPLADITAGHDNLTPARERELLREHYFGYDSISDLLLDEGLLDAVVVFVQAKLSDGTVDSFEVAAANLGPNPGAPVTG